MSDLQQSADRQFFSYPLTTYTNLTNLYKQLPSWLASTCRLAWWVAWWLVTCVYSKVLRHCTCRHDALCHNYTPEGYLDTRVMPIRNVSDRLFHRHLIEPVLLLYYVVYMTGTHLCVFGIKLFGAECSVLLKVVSVLRG